MTAYNLMRASVGSRVIVKTFRSRPEALTYARAIADVVEEDSDNLGCFDLLTRGGEVLSLEPFARLEYGERRSGDGPEGIEELAHEIGWSRACAFFNID